jgi:hypothetical protein
MALLWNSQVYIVVNALGNNDRFFYLPVIKSFASACLARMAKHSSVSFALPTHDVIGKRALLLNYGT